MTIRIITAAALAATSLISQVAFADAPAATTPEFTVTGSAAIVSQYKFRGLSQSDNLPAVQASVTLSHKSGFYVAMWGSSATHNTSPINIGGTEIDVYGGYTHGLGKSGLTVDVGGYGYIYPGATAGNYYELYGSLTKAYGPLSAKVGVNYAPAQKVFNFNFTSPTHNNTYVFGELGFSIPKTPITLHSHLGHTGGGFDYGKPYLDYTVGASYKWKALTFDISVVGTDLKTADVNNPGAFGCNAICAFRPAKTVGVASLTASF